MKKVVFFFNSYNVLTEFGEKSMTGNCALLKCKTCPKGLNLFLDVLTLIADVKIVEMVTKKIILDRNLDIISR